MLRWRPSTDPTIVGYDLYVRAPRTIYGPPQRVGLPARSADGTESFRLTQVPSSPTLYFAVAGYRSDGTESALSNEIAVGPTDPCLSDSCWAPDYCSLLPQPDGTACGPPTTDPCGSTCSGSVCGGATRAGLATQRLALVQSTHGVRLGGVGMVVSSGDIHVSTSGFSLAVRGPDGSDVFESYVSGDSLVSNANGTSFRYQAPRGAQTGLLRVSLRRSGDHYRLTVRAVVPGSTIDTVPDQLVWVVQIGDQCAGDAGLGCTRLATRMSCS